MSVFYYNRLQKFIFISDLAFLNVAMLIAHYLIFGNVQPNFASRAFIILFNLCWFLISFINKNYKISQPVYLNDIVDKFLMTLIYQSVFLLGTIYFFKILDISRGFVIITFFLFFLLIVIQRIWLNYFLKSSAIKRYLKKRVLVLGSKTIAESLISAFSNHPELGYETSEYIDDGSDLNAIKNIDLDRLLINKPEEIFICYKEMSIETLDRLILFGEQNSIKIKVVFDSISNNQTGKFNFDNIPSLHLNTQSKISVKVKILKRTFDMLFAAVIMIIGAPIFVLLYLITKITSSGKAFYKQERIGKNGEPFYIYKFRSMYVNSEKFGPQLSKDNDPRITKWGGIMRKTRLDELPQFWNVLKGEMAIVGYRPERKHFIEEIAKKTPDYKRLLHHKPGITSLGQVHYGYAENVDQMCERLRYDLLYFRNLKLSSDVDIIFKTVKVMVQGKGK